MLSNGSGSGGGGFSDEHAAYPVGKKALKDASVITNANIIFIILVFIVFSFLHQAQNRIIKICQAFFVIFLYFMNFL